MNRPLIVPFPGVSEKSRSDVGGKATSLIRMAEARLPVPPGTVLTTAFFAPWFEAIKASATWNRLTDSTPKEWASLCGNLKQNTHSLPFTSTQYNVLETLHRDLAPYHKMRYAVRSSSPEEDMATASFAGSYETQLGVHPDNLESAIRNCFASSLDVRVLSYKKEHGIDLWSPNIAVIVQQQLDSDVAGVGFSLNPLTNDYDEAAISANWGLGTSVVEGEASPDLFVIDKINRKIVDETRGAKQVSEWLDVKRGTVKRKAYRSAERTLTDDQLYELTDVIYRIEELYDLPVDIEWAYSNGKLHILQARPITTYVPLPPEMVTRPGERRRLYVDGALSKGLTTNEAISPLGLDYMKSLFMTILESRVGPLNRDVSPKDALFFFAGGRMYMNYSNILWLASPKRLARSAEPTDALMAQILAGIDAKRYRTAKRPSWMNFRLIWLIPRIIWKLRRFFWNGLYTILAPERAYRNYQQKVTAFESDLRKHLDDDLSIDNFSRKYEALFTHEMFDVLMPALIAGIVPPSMAVPQNISELKTLTEKLSRGATGNIVVEMGIALYHLANLLDQTDFKDLDRLAEKVKQRQMSQPFLEAWDDFQMKFGWRGPMEMDLASPRYADDPRLALRQMSIMTVDDTDYDPEVAHKRLVAERQEAFKELICRLGPLHRIILRKVYKLIDLFAGARDTPKHLMVLYNYVIRKRLLAEGRRLVREGRLDAVDEIFSFRFEDLKTAQGTFSNLRKIRDERMNFRKKLEAHLTSFPPVIDSRGRILRPPPTGNRPGLLSGMPVSPGVVTGTVKILHPPHEKTVEKGDVLVAYTTDPGWTPIFVNAAAILLEVGGVLQHGAVVAREYGKPCIVGIDRVASKLKDGQTVKVDGTAGTVQLLS